jgi:hypothetical protein
MIGYFNTDKDDVRVVVDYDHYADNPVRDSGIGLYSLEVNKRSYDVKGYDDKCNAEIDEAAQDGDVEWETVYEPSTEQRKDFAEQWLTERGIPFYTTTVTVYRDWVFTGIFYATEEDVTEEMIRNLIPLLSAWYNGDVYRMSFQKEAVYRNIDDPEDFLSKWIHFEDTELGDTCGDIYELSDVPGIVADCSEFTVVGEMEWGK